MILLEDSVSIFFKMGSRALGKILGTHVSTNLICTCYKPNYTYAVSTRENFKKVKITMREKS